MKYISDFFSNCKQLDKQIKNCFILVMVVIEIVMLAKGFNKNIPKKAESF